MKKKDILVMLDMGLAIVKDVTVANCLRRVENAQRTYLIAQADSGREKNRVLISAIAKLDREAMALEIAYRRVSADMGDKGREVMDMILAELKCEREKRVAEKNHIS
jgi:hypothetical protein